MTTATQTARPSTARPPTTRTTTGDVGALPAALRSEWIKLLSLRSNRVILALTVTVTVAAFAAWAVATLATDEVLTVSDVFVFPTLLVAVFSAIAAILLITSEVQHGTLAIAVAAQPARWVIAASKTVTATAFGLGLGIVGTAAGVGGAMLGGLAMGDTSTMVASTLAALLYTSLAAVLGLGVGMIVRHTAAAISGLLVWWFVVENLVLAFAPAKVARFLPFDAGYRILEVGSDFDSPEMALVALTRPQYALVFGAYAVTALIAGSVLLQRRDAV